MTNKTLLSRQAYEDFLKKIPDEVCSFCRWKEYQILLKEYAHWIWIANISPYWIYHTMLVPKRHFIKLSEMNIVETIEYVECVEDVLNIYQKARLKRVDGTSIEKYVYFWRYRANTFDPISKNNRPNHFHLHFAPDKDHLWDPVIEKNAHKYNLNLIKNG